MTALVWDHTLAPKYQSGVDRGVLYPSDGPGVVWNGLLSVAEKILGNEQKSYKIDGVTYLQTVSSRTFQATVQALSAPREFSPCVGQPEVIPGFSLTKQPRRHFSFSYRTMISDIGYKIHIVYNATASPTSRSYATTNDTPEPTKLEWAVDAVPEILQGYSPSAHYTIDSTKINQYALAELENTLYGTASTNPSLPEVNDLELLLEFFGGI